MKLETETSTLAVASIFATNNAKVSSFCITKGPCEKTVVGVAFSEQLSVRASVVYPLPVSIPILAQISLAPPPTLAIVAAATVTLNSLSISPSRKKNDDSFDAFRAVCTFDPPVVVEPGGRFNSEVLYLAVNESDPLQGLERYARAVAVANGIPTETRLVPNGWSVSGDFLNEAKILAELDVMAAEYKRYGWGHVSLGKGWQQSR